MLPIAVGELFRLIIAFILMEHVRNKERAFLCPSQLAVATNGGTEEIIHAARPLA